MFDKIFIDLTLSQRDINRRFKEMVKSSYIPDVTKSNIDKDAFLLDKDGDILCTQDKYDGDYSNVQYVGIVALSNLIPIACNVASTLITFQVLKLIGR